MKFLIPFILFVGAGFALSFSACELFVEFDRNKIVLDDATLLSDVSTEETSANDRVPSDAGLKSDVESGDSLTEDSSSSDAVQKVN